MTYFPELKLQYHMHLVPLEEYDPVQQYEATIKNETKKGTPNNATKVRYGKVGMLFTHVSVFSWLDQL